MFIQYISFIELLFVLLPQMDTAVNRSKLVMWTPVGFSVSYGVVRAGREQQFSERR